MRGREGNGRAARIAADRARLAEFEFEGFVPFAAWRDAGARLDAMEHAMRAKLAAGAPVFRLVPRRPAPTLESLGLVRP